LRFCAPSEVHHRTPAPSRRSEDRHVGRCFHSWAFVPFDASRNGGPVIRGASGPAACRVRGFDTSIATSTTVPPGTFRPRSVHGLHPSRPSPRVDGYPSRDPCPRVVPPVDSPRPHGERADGNGFRASFPARARSALGSPKGPEASMPSWVSPLQSTLSRRLSPPLWIAGDPLSRVGRVDVIGPPASQGFGARKDRYGPSRGYRLSWGFSPFDRRDAAAIRAGSGLISSPRGRALCRRPNRSVLPR